MCSRARLRDHDGCCIARSLPMRHALEASAHNHDSRSKCGHAVPQLLFLPGSCARGRGGSGGSAHRLAVAVQHLQRAVWRALGQESARSHTTAPFSHTGGGTQPCACGSSLNTRAAAPASAALGAPRSSNSPTAIADCAGAARSAPAVAEREELRVVATRPSGRSTRARAAQPSLGQARSDARVDCGTTQLIRGDSVPIRSAIVARR